MKKIIYLIFSFMIMGCTYQPKIFLNGQPVADNIICSYDQETGISTQSVIIKKVKEFEGNESYITNKYISLLYYNEFNISDIKDLIYVLTVNNTYWYKLTGSGYYYKLYKIKRVINHKNETLVNNKKLIYEGHLSFKSFEFKLPQNIGDEVSIYFEFTNKNDVLLFRTISINYKIKGD